MKHQLLIHIQNQKKKKVEPLPQQIGHPQQLPPPQQQQPPPQAQIQPGAPGNFPY